MKHMIKGWRDLFRTHILERGLDYYESRAIKSLKQTEKGYEATVEGTEEYHVEIEISDNRVYDMFCDCPYAEDGNYCKHMAAVLYEITEGQAESTDNILDKRRRDRNELEKTIENIPEAEIRGLVFELALEDESLRNRILTVYAEEIGEKQMIRLKKEVDGIAYRYSDRSGFVDYYHAMDYTDALSVFLNDKVQVLIGQGHLMQAFELTNYVFDCVVNQAIDDSDGGTTWVASQCYEIWQQILAVSDENEKRQMLRWFQSYRKNHASDDTDDYMGEYIEDFLLNEFQDPDLLKQRLKMLDKLIEEAGNDTDAGSWYSAYYGYEDIVLKRLQIMRKLGCSEQEIWEYRQKFRHFSAIRKMEIEEYLDRNDYEKAIEVLQESKELDQKYPGLVAEYSRRLIEIYKGIGQTDAYKRELEYQIFQCFQSDLDYIQLLKDVCVAGEWISYREEILKAKTATRIRRELMLREGLHQQLLEDIQQNGHLYDLDRYEKGLKKQYPIEVRDIYIDFVYKEAESVADRKHYKELMKYLKKIAAYPDGKKKAQEIAQTWRTQYKRRRAMMDELEKVVARERKRGSFEG